MRGAVKTTSAILDSAVNGPDEIADENDRFGQWGTQNERRIEEISSNSTSSEDLREMGRSEGRHPPENTAQIDVNFDGRHDTGPAKTSTNSGATKSSPNNDLPASNGPEN